jgi:hypothetical protein
MSCAVAHDVSLDFGLWPVSPAERMRGASSIGILTLAPLPLGHSGTLPHLPPGTGILAPLTSASREKGVWVKPQSGHSDRLFIKYRMVNDIQFTAWCSVIVITCTFLPAGAICGNNGGDFCLRRLTPIAKPLAGIC